MADSEYLTGTTQAVDMRQKTLSRLVTAGIRLFVIGTLKTATWAGRPRWMLKTDAVVGALHVVFLAVGVVAIWLSPR